MRDACGNGWCAALKFTSDGLAALMPTTAESGRNRTQLRQETQRVIGHTVNWMIRIEAAYDMGIAYFSILFLILTRNTFWNFLENSSELSLSLLMYSVCHLVLFRLQIISLSFKIVLCGLCLRIPPLQGDCAG